MRKDKEREPDTIICVCVCVCGHSKGEMYSANKINGRVQM